MEKLYLSVASLSPAKLSKQGLHRLGLVQVSVDSGKSS